MVLLALLSFASLAAASSSDKRGLVYVPDADYPEDNQVWVQSGSDLTWYYNYGDQPSPAFTDVSQNDFEFVPMMWGVSTDVNDTSFLDHVQELVDDGTKIKHVLGFNEPDASSNGGSGIDPTVAAQAWVVNFEPLADMGIKLGLPACTGGYSSIPWLEQFLGNCSEILSDGAKKKNCTWDFLPVHWYDNFAGLTSHIGEAHAKWPDADIWVTEYAYANQDLSTTQEYFNQSLDYFDKSDYIARYSWFGSFRSDVSNVGPEATFLNNGGELTDLGAWYLGFDATGVDPESGSLASTLRGDLHVTMGVCLLAALCLWGF